MATHSGIDQAKECGVDRVVVFYPTSKIHLEAKMHKGEDEAVESFASTSATRAAWG